MSIDQKLEQLYAALGEMNITERLATIKPTTVVYGNHFATSIDFTKVADRGTAANRVSLLINNIACLKDHLHAWCRKSGKPLTGDLLINSNRDVAIVHDLWNVDKHAELNRPSRSGLSPRLLQPARSTLTFKGGGSEPPMFTIPVFGGRAEVRGDASLRISATVVDKDGIVLDELEAISLRAVAAWEAEIVKAGAKLPPLP